MVLSYYIAIAQPAIVPATQMKQTTPKVTIPRTSKTMSTLFLQRHSKVHCVPQTQVQVSNRYLSTEIATETRQKTTFYAIKEKIQIVSIRIIATNKFFGTYTYIPVDTTSTPNDCHMNEEMMLLQGLQIDQSKIAIQNQQYPTMKVFLFSYCHKIDFNQTINQ